MKKVAFGPVRLEHMPPGLRNLPLPLSDVFLSENGQLGKWQIQNAKATIPHLIRNLIDTGTMANIELLGTPDFAFKGMWFADSDIYKSLEALAWSAQILDDSIQREFLERATRAIAGAQEGDGYINSWYQGVHPELKWKEFNMGHEMYVAGHFIQAAIAEARILGNPGLIELARKFADLLVNKFSSDIRMCGHPEIETALIELYRETKVISYLDLAEMMILSRGYQKIKGTNSDFFAVSAPYMQDHKPVLEADTAVGHCVRQLYLNAGVMDLYLERKDDRLLKVQEAQWEDMVYTKMYITGGLGSRHKDEAFGDSYELPNDRAYAETCASIANFMWDWRLLLATGRGRYADNMERALYNIIAGSVSSDRCKFFYSNPLQYRKGHFVAFDTDASERLGWYRCSCCPPNIARLVATFNSYIATTSQNGLSIHLYTDSKISTHTMSGTPVELTITTNYPQSGEIAIHIANEESYELNFRIPEWSAENYSIAINGEDFSGVANANGYVSISRRWRKGDLLNLSLDMKAQYLRPHPLIDASRGCVSIVRGPVVYAVEQADVNDENLDLETFVVDTTKNIEEKLVNIGEYGESLALVINGSFSPPEPDYGFAYAPKIKQKNGIERSITAIPYSLWGNRTKGAMRVWIPEDRDR